MEAGSFSWGERDGVRLPAEQALLHRKESSSSQVSHNQQQRLRVRFWGVRGSTPAPAPSTLRYGGNTPCLEVRADEKLFILDAGTGLRELGRQLLSEFAVPGLEAYLFLSHYHWDHIQGLPFFEPLYFSGNTFHIFGPRLGRNGLPAAGGIIQTLFSAPYFPVSPQGLESAYSLGELDGESELRIGHLRIATCRLNHPQGSLAYRFECHGVTLVYATDHEPGDPAWDAALQQLAAGADLFISDAQYRSEELGAQRLGWGHGSWESSVALARAAGVKHLVLFHHDPMRTDDELDEILAAARQAFPCTWAAAEGAEVEASRQAVRMRTGAEDFKPQAAEASLGTPVWAARPAIEVRHSPRSFGAAGQLPAPGRPQRRYERISLQETNAYTILNDSAEPAVARVLDLSFGGVSFLLDTPRPLPESFFARLHVPLLPTAEIKLRHIYTQPVSTGLLRVGCSFGA